MATPSNTNHNGPNLHSPTPNASPPPLLSSPPPPPPPPRPRQFFQSVWKNRNSLVLGAVVVYATTNYLIQWRRQVIADFISPDTVLHWRITDGSIVETTTGTTLIKQLSRSLEPGAEKHKVSTMYEVIRAIKLAKDDDRIVGIMANMSSSSAAQSQANRAAPLGMAQVQELRDAIKEFKETKKAKLGEDKVKVIAFTDTFDNQTQYYLASAFDKVYVQPTGFVPLVGLASQVPFVKNLLNRFGIYVRGEARKEYKSITSTFTETSLPPPQHKNLDAVLTTFNENMIRDIAESRCHALGVEKQQAERELTRLIYEGPFLAEQAEQAGLIDGRLYNRQCGALVSTNGAMGLGHYRSVRETERSKKLRAGPSMVVGIVYLVGGIGRGGGMFGANTVVRALREAANDETVDAIVLRIDSGGGDVVASDTIADAVRYVKEEKGIPIVASFGNTSASGGYYVSTHCDRIIASPSTLTGSIGVAAIRPYISDEFFKMTGINVDQIFKGSKAQSMLHDLTGEELERYRRQVDAMYADFTHRVAEGRHMDLAKVEEIARGKIWAASDAAKVGLVDELGGTYRAVRLAAELGLERLKAERERLLEQMKAPEKQTGPANTDVLRRRRAVLMVPDQVGDVSVKIFPAPKPFFQRLSEASRNEEADAVTDAWVRDRALRVGVKLLAFALGEEFERVLGIQEETVGIPRLETEELRIR